MRRLLRILHVIATILAVVVSVAIVTGLAVESSWFKQWLRGYIVRAANERLNGTLSIGRLSGNLYSRVQLDDVKVVMDGLPVIAIDKVSATFSIRDMISKGIVIDRVDVTRPIVAMHRDESGWDLGRFIRKRPAGPETKARPITIRQLTIDGGAFSMVRPGQPTIALDAIEAGLLLKYETRHFTFDIAHLSFASKDPAIVVPRATGLVELRDDDLVLGGLSLHTAESHLSVNGVVRQYRSAPVFDLHVHSDPLSLPEIRKVFSGIGTTKLRPAIDVRIDGPLDRLQTDFSLQSPSGDVTAKGVTHITSADRSFDGDVSMRRLNLSQFLDNQDWRSEIDAVAKVKLRVSPPATGRPSSSFLDSLHGDIDLSGPTIHVRDVILDDVRAKARLNGRIVELGSLQAQAFGIPLTTAGTVTLPGGDHHELNFDVTGRVSNVNLARLPSWMQVPPAETRLNGGYHVTGTVPIGRPGTLVEGEATFDPSMAAGMNIDRGAMASFHVRAGDLSDLRFTVDGQVSALDLQRIGREFRIQTLATDRYRSALNGRLMAAVHGWGLDTMDLTATGTLVNSSMFSGTFPQVSFDTTIRDGALRVKANGQVEGVDLAIVADRPSLNGSVTGTIDTDITFARLSSGVSLDSVDAEVTADLGPVSAGDINIDRASISGEYHKGFADIQQLNVTGSDITATGNGTLSFTDSGESGFWLHANASRLDAVADLIKRPLPLSGIATLDAVISGNRGLFVANGNLNGDGVKYDRFGALTLASKFSAKIPDLDWQQAMVTADTMATFVDIPGLQINEVTAHTDYAGRRVSFEVTGSQPQRTLAAAGSVEFQPGVQEVRLERLQFDTHGMTWQAEAGHEPTITFGPNGVGVADFHLVNNNQRISAEGGFGRPTDRLTLTLDNVDVGLIDAWLLRPPQLGGRLNAKAEITGTKDAPAVDTEFKVSNGKFRDVAYASLGGRVKYSGAGLDVDVELQQTASQWLTAKGHVPLAAFRAKKQSDDRFNLRVDSSPIDLGLVQGLTSEVTRVKGTLQATFDVTGAADDPRLNGAITVKDGAFRLETTGVSYTGLDGRIDLLPDRVHIDDLHLLDNQSQQLTASGDLSVSGLQVGDVNLYFSAMDFKVLDNDMGNLRLNSDLRLTGTLAHPRIEGELDVSTGTLNLDQILARIGNSPYATTAAEAPGTTGEEPTETESSWRRPQLTVHLVIPKDLVIRAKDVRTSNQALGLGSMNLTLGGDLNLSAKAGQPMTVVGAVNTVRGFWDFQGRRFQILRDGSVRFEGEPINSLDPALNVSGERVIQAVTARVNIRGRLKKPEVELTSVPPLEQSDILALIVFNQPLNQLGTGQQASLAQRAGAMAAGAVSSELTTSVAQSLGVDQLEVNVAPAIGVTAEVIVGQQLSQNLYVKLQQEIGTYSQTNVILEYEFTRWLRLQTNLLQGAAASQQPFQHIRSTGVDLVFTFDFK